MRILSSFIFLILFVVLLGFWLVAFAAFHVAGGAVHLLLIIAIAALILHFVRGARAT